MILVAGIPDERPVALVIDALDALGASVRVLDQRSVAAAAITLAIGDGARGDALTGSLVIDGEPLPLEEIRAFYLRLMDDQLLPAVNSLSPGAPARQHSRRFHERLLQFADLMPGRVLNRPSSMASNQSKPFQAQHIRACGFDIPDTLITNDPSAACAFIEEAWAGGGGVIYKSVSGVRSIVQRVEAHDLGRLERIRWCPTQFQRLVTGTDIRVHVVGDTVLAAAITSGAVDYRYAARQVGVEAAIEPVALEPDMRTRCVRLAQHLELPLAGIDLRRTPEGRHVCFEVNPSPAFSYYEERAGIPVSTAIARYLTGDAA
jgi:glutathione synthase/RimK-type ligase-like ATP-grasp enzyme